MMKRYDNTVNQWLETYLEVNKTLKEKYDELKLSNFLNKVHFIEYYNSLLEPLHNINQKLQQQQQQQQHKQQQQQQQHQQPQLQKLNIINVSNLGKDQDTLYLSLLRQLSYTPCDTIYGLRLVDNRLYMGNQSVTIKGNELVFENGQRYTLTNGLRELIISKVPNRNKWTTEDYNNYRDIVIFTNTWLLDNNPYAKSIKTSNTYKYHEFIKNIVKKHLSEIMLEHTNPQQFVQVKITPQNRLQQSMVSKDSLHATVVYDNPRDMFEGGNTNLGFLPTPSTVRGSGTLLYKNVTNTPKEYVYWNTLEELLERLYILQGELKAGNNNPNITNEITNILQEIKEI